MLEGSPGSCTSSRQPGKSVWCFGALSRRQGLARYTGNVQGAGVWGRDKAKCPEPYHWINVWDPLYFLGYGIPYLCKEDPFVFLGSCGLRSFSPQETRPADRPGMRLAAQAARAQNHEVGEQELV